MAKEYLDRLPNDCLHIRSNINEVFRNFYRKQIKVPLSEGFPPETMALCYSKKAQHDERIQAYFSQFTETVGFSKIYNYDPFDMFYWEYRLGTWHSNLLLESDIAHETFCLFNNRFLLKTILSLPKTLLSNDFILHRLIDEHWPLLHYWPINNERKGDEQITSGGLNLEDGDVFAHAENGEIITPYFKPMGNHALFYMDINAPKKGDHLIFRKPIPVKRDQGYNIVLVIQSPYERRKLHGRIEYLISLDGVEICSEDIADWSRMNLIQIVFQGQSEKCLLEVEIRAIKDCETWNWGQAAKLFVQSLDVHEVNFQGKPMAMASSPFTRLKVETLTREMLRDL